MIEGHPRLKTAGEFLEGITEQGCREIIATKTSIWDDILPSDWKGEIISALRNYQGIFNEFVNHDSLLKLLASAMKKQVPWFDKVVPPWYLKSEIGKIKRDLATNYPT